VIRTIGYGSCIVQTLGAVRNHSARHFGALIVDGSEPVAQNPSPYETEAFTAEDAEHAERRSRVE